MKKIIKSIIWLVILVVIITFIWNKINLKKSQTETDEMIKQEKILNEITNTSDSSNLDDIESDINIDIDLSDLNEIDTLLDEI